MNNVNSGSIQITCNKKQFGNVQLIRTELYFLCYHDKKRFHRSFLGDIALSMLISISLILRFNNDNLKKFIFIYVMMKIFARGR